jgi:LacI family transcriptional regulator
VCEAIAQLSYRPNNSARSLAGNKSYLVGLLYDNPSAHYVLNIQSGVLAACRTSGYDLVIHPCNYQAKDINQELITLVRHSRMDGLILTPPLSDMLSVTRTLDQQAVPYVRVAPLLHDNVSPCVYCDDHHAAYEMTNHLIELGHKRIGFIAGHPDHGASAERQAGFEDALRDHGMKIPKELFAQGYFNFESGKEGGKRLLSLRRRPTAIFCSSDEMACGVIHAALGMGISIPGQLSVTGFDDSPIAEQVWPPLTTVKQPVEHMAEQATLLLLNRLRGQTTEYASEASLKCRLVVRETTSQPFSQAI